MQTLCNTVAVAVILFNYAVIESLPVHNHTTPLTNISEALITSNKTISVSEATNMHGRTTATVRYDVVGSHSTTESVWTNYDQSGAKDFIITTVVVYSLVGTLTLLLLRMCRRAQRVHNKTDRSDEMVDAYLRVLYELKDQGDRYRMLCQKQRTCRTLTSIEEQRSLSSNSNSNDNDGDEAITPSADGDNNNVFLSTECDTAKTSAATVLHIPTTLTSSKLDNTNSRSISSENCEYISEQKDKRHLLVISEEESDDDTELGRY